MDKKREQDFAALEVKRLCGVFGTPIPALPLERDKALDKVKAVSYTHLIINSTQIRSGGKRNTMIYVLTHRAMLKSRKSSLV